MLISHYLISTGMGVLRAHPSQEFHVACFSDLRSERCPETLCEGDGSVENRWIYFARKPLNRSLRYVYISSSTIVWLGMLNVKMFNMLNMLPIGLLQGCTSSQR